MTRNKRDTDSHAAEAAWMKAVEDSGIYPSEQ